jgi:hypothetical protein
MKVKFKRGYYRNLFTWKELSTLINIRPLMSSRHRVEVFSLGKKWKWKNSPWTPDPSCYPPSVMKECLTSYMCQFGDMSRCSKKLNDLAKRLEEEYNMTADAQVYTCPNIKLDHPFGIHFDKSDNVIVQCEGRTNFKVWEKVEPDSEESKLTIEDPPIMDVEMRPGDAIWIPKYYPHLATSRTKRMSVSFPLVEGEKQPREWVKL